MKEAHEQARALDKEGKLIPVEDLLKKVGKGGMEKISLPAKGTTAMPLEKLYAERTSGIVAFYRYSEGRASGAYSTGTILTREGHAFVNYHTLHYADGKIYADTGRGRVHAIEAVVAADRERDMAIVKLSGEGFRPVPLRTGAPVGTAVSIIAHPDGYFDTLTTGVLARKYRERRRWGEMEVFDVTAEFGVGSSGGPVLDAEGNALGFVAITRAIQGNHGGKMLVQMMVRKCIPSEAVLERVGGK
jgi:S1-C subfamily serine protease